ncbi:hypothetical protein GCM10027048_00820 [Hymenobacter coalescens]
MHPFVLLYILLPSIVGVMLFRAIGRWLNAERPRLKQYANAFTLAAVLWGPLQALWVYNLGQSRDYYIDDRSQPPIRYSRYRGYVYPQKLVKVPKYHCGVGYKFSLGNPLAKFLYDQLGGLRLTYIMSAVDVLILGCLFSAVLYAGKWVVEKFFQP